MYLKTLNTELLLFYAAQLIYFLFVLLLFRNLYPRISKGLLNNMCLLVMTGFVMITRLSYDESVRQFRFACIGTVIALIVPVIIRKLHLLTKMTWAYAFVGIGLLGLVMVASRSVNGAKLTLTIGGFAFQPSEFVKIIFVFAVAGLLAGEHSLKRIITATVLAAVHVGILVISTDLGSALIFFVTYLVMLFVATRNPFLVSIGVLAGAAAAVAAYFLFSHVRVRVQIWKDPFADYAGSGYQICQSLFSIAAGGWLGTGLYQGSPGAIPYVEEDFMFSAILEEMGGIFGLCLILVCLAVFIMFVNIAMKLESRFYRLAAVGFGAIYATQVFLTIGGGTKLIPMTGVTLPLVSYGGSSLLSTLIMIAIVQGLYMLRSDEVREEYETERSRISEPGQPYRD
jgi:cell division protein FtsW (lipid II flippase)